jgi:hypothetical protein
LSLHNTLGYYRPRQWMSISIDTQKRGGLMRCWLLAIIFAACGGDDGNVMPIDASVDMAQQSDCGNPGDVGNELGVGKYCPNGISDCSNTPMAPLCSSLGDPNTHFCTKTCQMGSTGTCGTGAECVCNGNNQCGCTPSSCLGP